MFFFFPFGGGYGLVFLFLYALVRLFSRLLSGGRRGRYGGDDASQRDENGRGGAYDEFFRSFFGGGSSSSGGTSSGYYGSGRTSGSGNSYQGYGGYSGYGSAGYGNTGYGRSGDAGRGYGGSGYSNPFADSEAAKLSAAYKTLGLTSSATDDEVKKAYRKLSLQYHPDRVQNKGDEYVAFATRRFTEIQNAYDVIKKARGIV